MSLGMYQASAPVYLHYLTSLNGVLDKGAAYAEANKIDPTVLVNARLFPTMFPLSRQVQIATDQTKGALARLSGSEIPSWPDTETTFPELKSRVTKALDYVKTFKPEQIDGSEEKTITLKIGGQDMNFTGAKFLLHFSLPNFFFHVTTAYAILRHNGVPIGKPDFMAGLL